LTGSRRAGDTTSLLANDLAPLLGAAAADPFE
jgi:hypothetical protein